MKRRIMKKLILIGLAGLMLTGCGYRGSLIIKDNEVIVKSNKPMTIEVDLKNKTAKYSSQKTDRPLWERIGKIIRPDSVSIGNK